MSGNTTLVFETVHGSRAFGLETPSSDTDYKGIIVGPSAWYLGYLERPEQEILSADHVRFEIRKFFTLIAATNPTVIEMLWCDPSDHVTVTRAGERLIDARDGFLSKRVRGTFAGYARSQLKRIKTHRAWLLNPPEAEPTRGMFGLPERTLIPRDQQGAAETLMARGEVSTAALSPNFLEILEREKAYRRARKSWEQYRGWLENRNRDRAALEARFGYDTKHAMHLVRLQRMAVEILRDKRVQVKRPDREELLAIRNGAWTYDALMERCEALEADIIAAAQLSALPETPDEAALDRLCIELVEEVLYENSGS